MIPVDEGKISVASTPSNFAASRQIRSHARFPCAPVAQFALPEFTTTARTRPPVASKEARSTSRGAATTRLRREQSGGARSGHSFCQREIGTAADFDSGSQRGKGKSSRQENFFRSSAQRLSCLDLQPIRRRGQDRRTAAPRRGSSRLHRNSEAADTCSNLYESCRASPGGPRP